jgi:4-aminobutyrate aminotransferase-like enzyme
MRNMNDATAYPSNGIEVIKAEGVWLINSKGEYILDGCAGTFNVGLGYAHSEITQAIFQQANTGLLHGSGTLNLNVVRQAENALVSIAPPSLNRCHLKGSTGGSTAVEQALRHAWAVTGKTAIVSFINGHHGQTIASTLASGMHFRKERLLKTVSFPIVQVDFPDCYRCPFGKTPEKCGLECEKEIIDIIDTTINKEKIEIAAFLAEPILGAGGGITPPIKFWQQLSENLNKRSIPLIFDEVQTFGRTGHFFAANYYGVTPTMIAIAKAISGIGMPGAAALLLPENYCVLYPGEDSLTWGGSAIVSSAIYTTIEVMRRPLFFEHVKSVSELLNLKLEEIARKYDCIGCVRGTGLMTGIEVVESKISKVPAPSLATQIIKASQQSKLILRQSLYGKGSFIKVRPALVIDHTEVEELSSRLDWSINQTLANI